MSKQLLYELNGTTRGRFRRFLDGFKGEPRIAWYPSAGEDFRDLLYLHPSFAQEYPAHKPEPSHPNIFLHTDYFPRGYSNFLDDTTIYLDGRTSISVAAIEQLSRMDLPLDAEIVNCPERSYATGRVVFLEIDVQSDILGSFKVPVVYAFVENAAFCAKKIFPFAGRFSHIIHVRYGGGFGGGGKSSGAWLHNILKQVHCEVYITDGNACMQSGDERAIRLYPELGDRQDYELVEMRIIQSEKWSGHGNVSWNIVM